MSLSIQRIIKIFQNKAARFRPPSAQGRETAGLLLPLIYFFHTSTITSNILPLILTYHFWNLFQHTTPWIFPKFLFHIILCTHTGISGKKNTQLESNTKCYISWLWNIFLHLSKKLRVIILKFTMCSDNLAIYATTANATLWRHVQ